MDIAQATPEEMLKRLEVISLHLTAQEDYWATKQAEILRQELEYYFETQKQRNV
jgi:hypothetical protein